MSGLIIGDPINDEIIERLMENRLLMNRYGEPDDMRIDRLEGGNIVLEKENFRPTGGVYYKNVKIPNVIPSGGYPQYPIYDQLELRELDLMGANTHISDWVVRGVVNKGAKLRDKYENDEVLEGEGIFGKDVSRGFKKGMKKVFGNKAGKAINKAIHTTGDVLRPIANVGLDIGAMAAAAPLMAVGVDPITASVAPQALANITKGYLADPDSYQNKNKVANKMLNDAKLGEIAAKEIMKNYKQKNKAGGNRFKPAVMDPEDLINIRSRKLNNKAIGMMKPAVIDMKKIGGARTKSKAGPNDKRKLRGEMIKKLMKDNNMTLPQASKYIKENHLI